jgi:AraC family transcriptional regulator of adaptative response/methylated-DNA-[protein]-cysteine methyltransferase
MPASDYARIERAIGYLETHAREQPELRAIARHVGLSEFHFQRLFRRWAGVSPKRFLQFLTADYARRLLERSHTVLDAAHDAGLSGGGRLHDLMISIHAATPGELRQRGAGLVLRYGFHPTPFGECLVALTGRGIAALAFVTATREQALAELQARWPHATLRRALADTRAIAEHAFAPARRGQPLTLHLPGSNFQIKVWEALLRVPPGAALSYETLAESIGAPRATRAVASAVARNPVAVLIPCHRVIRKTGAFGEYHWGPARKQALLAWEAAQVEGAAPNRDEIGPD